MRDLELFPSDFTPKVLFNWDSGKLSIVGNSMPEDARSFYKPLVQWIENYGQTSPKSVSITIFLKYFNSSSTKQFLKIFYAIEDIKEQGASAEIIWQTVANDTMLKEKGQDFIGLIEVPFTFQEVNEDGSPL